MSLWPVLVSTVMAEGEKTRSGPLYLDRNLQIIFGITLMAVLGVASISPALPTVAGELGISTGQVGLLITAFTLPGIVLTPVLGILSDRIGRRKVIVPSLMLFGLAGGAAAFSSSFEVMVGLRLLQGMGAAALGTINVTMIGDIYSGHERTAAMGYNSSVLSLGTGSYPLIGGLLATFGWHYPFLLPFVAIPVGLLAFFSLRNPEPCSDRGMKEYFADLVSSVKDRRVLGLLGVTLTTFTILYGAQITYLPILMENRFDAPPYLVGIVLSSAPVATAITSWQLGRLTERFSEKYLIMVAFALYAIALSIIPLVPTLYLLFVPTLIFGVAQGINLPNVFSLLTGSVAAGNRGALLSMNGMLLRTGQTIGPLLMGAFAGLFAIGGAYYAIAAISLVMLAVALLTIK